MAASFCRRSFLNYRNFLFNIQKRTGYVVLIPETPEEAGDFNFISLENLPDFSLLRSKTYIHLFNQYAQQYDFGSWEIHEHLEKQVQTSEKVDVFKNVIEPLEVLLVPFLTTWGLVRTLHVSDKSIVTYKQFTPSSDRVLQIRNDKFDRKSMYLSCKKQLEEDSDKCTEEQTRILKKFVWEGFHNGLDLEVNQRATLKQHCEVLEVKRKLYEMKYINSLIQFRQVIEDDQFKTQAPLDLLRNSCVGKNKPEQGPWVITLKEPVYRRYLEYCTSRESRLHIWESYNQIASNFLDGICNATGEIESIRLRRQEIARILGFETYAHMAMKTKMAGSVENVQVVLSELLEAARFGQEKEVYELEKFAFENGFEGRLELWDLPYWEREHRDHELGLSEDKLKEYFPLGQVLLGLIALCEQLFGIEIQEQKAVDCWGPDVRYFRISDEKTKSVLGGFYFDPYASVKKSIGEKDTGTFIPVRPRSKVIASLPLSALIFSFTPPQEETPSLLYYREVKNLFSQFGFMLQYTLTEANYTDVSGMNNVEWDTLGISGNFLEFWLTERGTVESISEHYKTGEPLPNHTLEALCNVHKHMAGTRLSREIYWANLDLYMHLRDDPSTALVGQLWPQHFLFTLHKNDGHVFGFKDIFLSPLGSCVFGKVWSKMVAADVFWAFVEAGLDNLQEVSALGRRFRSTFLALSGACDAGEIFKRFRGREPDPRALINLLELPKPAYIEPDAEPKLSLPESEK